MGWFQDLLKEVPVSSVLRERLELAADRVQRSEEKVTELSLQLDDARKEIASLRDSIALKDSELERFKGGALGEVAEKVLAHFVEAEDDSRDVGIASVHLRLKRAIVEFHLDELESRGYATCTGGNYVQGHVYWGVTPEGRKYAVLKGLVG